MRVKAGSLLERLGRPTDEESLHLKYLPEDGVRSDSLQCPAGGKGLENSASTKGSHFWNECVNTVGSTEERITLLVSAFERG